MMKRQILVGVLTGCWVATAVCAQAPVYTPQALTLTPTEMTKLSQMFPSDEGAIHILWDKTPIAIELPVGKERLVTFPGVIEFGYDTKLLPADKLTVQNNNGTLYLTAHAPFSVQRVQAKTADGKIILLDVSSKTSAPKTPIMIATDPFNGMKMPATLTPPKSASQQSGTDEDDTETEHKPITAVALTRFAAQSLYAPARPKPSSAQIFRTPMKAHSTEPLLLDGSVMASPTASWHADDLYVTAVLIRNQLPHRLTLDPRQLCGSWRAASFFPRNALDARGQTHDSTTLFVISDVPFNEAIKACVGGAA